MEFLTKAFTIVSRDAAHPSQGCTIETCPVSLSVYGYLPSKPLNIVFLILFILSFLGHVFLGAKRRAWSFLTALGIGTLMEVAGYLGRIQMHKDPFKRIPLATNLICLTVAPAFMAAGLYLTLKHLVIIIGPKYSRFAPQWYTRAFIACDITSIIIQTGGSTLSTKVSLIKTPNIIMELGIATQVLTLLIFGGLALEFYLRYRKDSSQSPPLLDAKVMRAIIAVIFAYFVILIRCIYRIAEMAGGWRNPIMRDQVAFVVLDGIMSLVACLALNVFHPGAIFQRSKIVSKGVDSEVGVESAESAGVALEKKTVA